MSKTLIGITAFGGLPFLRLLLDQIKETTSQVDVMVVVAKPGDAEMRYEIQRRGIGMIIHEINKGFAASINDLLDSAFQTSQYDHLIIAGNDTVPMSGCIDAMIKCAEESEWETISATEFDSRSLVASYPEASQYFHGPNHHFVDFSAKPWELHKYEATGIQPDCFKDIRNMTLYKRLAFERAGYADTNFWPNAYFEDNDYARRCVLLGVKSAGLLDASFFHFWSRTIHQGEARPNNVYFDRNRAYYVRKWGGDPNRESYPLPHQGQTLHLSPKIFLPGTLKIDSRESEPDIIKYWSHK